MSYHPSPLVPIVATISKLPTALNRLPLASEVVLPGFYPWSPIPTGDLTAALGLDRGLWATWRCRGIGPAELPTAWFRPAPGRPCYYMVSAALAWIARRRGEPFDPIDAWRLSLARDLGTEATSPAAVRRWAQVFAQATGPHTPGGVNFTRSGFAAYLTSLEAAS